MDREFKVSLKKLDEDLDGEILYTKKEINVDVALLPQDRIATTLHELSHAIIEESGVRPYFENKEIEMICEVFGLGMARFMRNNEHFFEDIEKWAKEQPNIETLE
jgi:Cys-tRNA synthase (O-phospho-L-seryl-tRNA:Cys-tRNA synthase)